MWTIEINIAKENFVQDHYDTFTIESEHPFFENKNVFYALRNGAVQMYVAKVVNQDFALKRYIVVAQHLGESKLPEHLNINTNGTHIQQEG
jgi:hypothetical protein